MSEYPEHEKLSEIKEQSQWLGEFIDGLEAKGLLLAKVVKKEIVCPECSDRWGMETAYTGKDDCEKCHGERWIPNDFDYGLTPARIGLQELLAMHFNIDLKKIDEEKKAMLESLRKANA